MSGAWDAAAAAVLGPPRWVFHGAVATATLWALAVVSSPGVAVLPLSTAVLLLLAATALWTGKLVAHLVRTRRHDSGRSARWFLIAPIAGVLVVALSLSGTAFSVRWALSRGAFERAVAVTSLDEPGGLGRVGLYRVFLPGQRIDEAVFFTSQSGSGLFDDAGFAYLPAGLTPAAAASFEALRVEHIDGPWYRWTSSW